jgi:hypothetical protein
VLAKTPVQRDGKVEDFSRRTERAAWTWRLERVIWAARSKYTKASTIILETSYVNGTVGGKIKSACVEYSIVYLVHLLSCILELVVSLVY